MKQPTAKARTSRVPPKRAARRRPSAFMSVGARRPRLLTSGARLGLSRSNLLRLLRRKSVNRYSQLTRHYFRSFMTGVSRRSRHRPRQYGPLPRRRLAHPLLLGDWWVQREVAISAIERVGYRCPRRPGSDDPAATAPVDAAGAFAPRGRATRRRPLGLRQAMADPRLGEDIDGVSRVVAEHAAQALDERTPSPSLSAQIRPPCASTMPRQIARPRPYPSISGPSSSIRENLLNRRGSCSAEIPGPRRSRAPSGKGPPARRSPEPWTIGASTSMRWKRGCIGLGSLAVDPLESWADRERRRPRCCFGTRC